MSKTYLYKKGSMQLGPYPLDKMRALARQGQVGRSHQISGDGGNSWDAGAAYPEIFAAGEDGQKTGPSFQRPTSGGRSPEAAGAPTEAMWHYCSANSGQQGPVPESQIRQLIGLGRIGPNDTVWTESLGDQWASAKSVPMFSGLFPRTDAAEPEGGDHGRRKERRRDKTSSSTTRQETAASNAKGFNGAGLSGFICSMVAVVLLVLPCLVWVVVAESFFWIFNIVIPFTVLAIVGLVLSVIGLSKTPRGMATTGTVLGVIALMLGIMATAGWFLLPYRLAMQRRTQIDTFATDIKLEQKNLADELVKYRQISREDGESDPSFEARASLERRLVGEHLTALVKGYDNHVSATAKTAEFRQAFADLAVLRKTLDEVKQAAQTVESVEVIDVLQAANADVRAIKVLMDTLRLYERGEITLKQAEAKMTGR